MFPPPLRRRVRAGGGSLALRGPYETARKPVRAICWFFYPGPAIMRNIVVMGRWVTLLS
jgi:hypothetical protein